jgi:NiFe hydrogenase small subunit HydA
MRNIELPVIQESEPPLIAGMSHRKGIRLPVMGEPVIQEGEPSGIPGVSRRDFLRVCATAAALLGLGSMGIPRIAEALIAAATKRPSVVWLNFASDTGCTEALIKASYPNAAQLILEILSLDYNETIMAAAGYQAEEILHEAKKRGDYILIIEGAIPTKKGYGMIARREMIDIGKEFAAKAKAVIAVGSCATWGGVPAGDPNPAGLKGVREALGVPAINLDLCPVNEGILVATIVDFLLTNRVPELDGFGRPKIFYGQTIHDQCERRAHFDAGRFVEPFAPFGGSVQRVLLVLIRVAREDLSASSSKAFRLRPRASIESPDRCCCKGFDPARAEIAIRGRPCGASSRRG